MPITARRRLGFAALSIIVIAYAALALASGAARLGSDTVIGGANTPITNLLSAKAQNIAAATALDQEDAQGAAQLAARAVSANPSDAQALGLLGTAQLANADRDNATATFAIAGQLGWRDLPTQLFWLDSAVRAQEWDLAAQRLDAVLRTQPSLVAMNELLLPLETGGESSRAALAKRLAMPSSWRRRYLDDLGTLTDQRLAARSQVLASGDLADLQLGCGAIAPLAGALIDGAQRSRANAIWRKHCDDAGLTGNVFDARFALLGSEGMLPGFGWQMHPAGSVSVRASNQGGTATVETENLGSVTALALSQKSDLPAGQYRIDVRSRGEGSGNVAAAISCGGGALAPPKFTPTGAPDRSVTVPSPCTQQRLTLWVAPGNGAVSIGVVSISAVEAVRIP